MGMSLALGVQALNMASATQSAKLFSMLADTHTFREIST